MLTLSVHSELSNSKIIIDLKMLAYYVIIMIVPVFMATCCIFLNMNEWYTALHSLHRQLWVRAPAQTSTNACGHICKYVDQKGLAVMLTSIQSAGVTPEVNLIQKGIHLGLETQGRRHQKSKTGVSVTPREGLMSYKNFKKKSEHVHLFLDTDDLADFDIRTGSGSEDLTTNQLCYHYDGVMRQGTTETFYCIQPLVPSHYVSIHMVMNLVLLCVKHRI